MTTLNKKENAVSSQPVPAAIAVRRSGNHRTPGTFWFVVKDGRTARAVLTRYRRRRLVKLGYACAIRSGCDSYPETFPDCTVIIDDGPS